MNPNHSGRSVPVPVRAWTYFSIFYFQWAGTGADCWPDCDSSEEEGAEGAEEGVEGGDLLDASLTSPVAAPASPPIHGMVSTHKQPVKNIFMRYFSEDSRTAVFLSRIEFIFDGLDPVKLWQFIIKWYPNR